MSVPNLWVRSEFAPHLDDADLLQLIPHGPAYTWLRSGEGLVAWGLRYQIRTRELSRFSDASQQWRELSQNCHVDDAVHLPGTGLVSFGSFAFSRHSTQTSTLNIPEFVIGRRDGRTWVSAIATEPVEAGFSQSIQPHPAEGGGVLEGEHAASSSRIEREPGDLSATEWQQAVQKVIGHIQSGRVHKVVMAREEYATSPEPIDLRRALGRLASTYSSCWTFHVDGLMGATPELLIRKEKGLLASRVLAGTVKRSGDDREDAARALELAHDSKERSEHQYAVRSLLDSISSVVASTVVPDEPFVLRLPNVMHLATDVSAVLTGENQGLSSLDLAAMAHPTAAVCGTPTQVAAQILAEHEGFDRGRYAAPVGWMSADGDGEWGIALRCGELVAKNRMRLFAGCGIMAASDPATEFAETEHKFAPMRSALGS